MPDYGSHLPVLTMLLGVMRPRRVLEFGGGHHSTPAILDCPSVTKLATVEVDKKWRDELAETYPDDRLSLRRRRPEITMSYGLILIDDGTDIAHRVRTIRYVLSQQHPPVMIHDAEVPEYATAIEEFAINYSVFPTNPDTAVVWG